jgi:C4-dicarboxylate-specific signal transduction histidine kinase
MKEAGDWRAIAREELRFFGDVSAAISHEINNRIAVISEKAGLLEDLATMLAQGKEVDPDRLGEQSRKIIEQVRLARQIVRNFNRFAHSVDVEQATVEVTELLEFVVELYARKADMANATLSVSKSSQAVTITTSPFVLETVVGRVLEIALASIADGGRLSIAAEAADEVVRVSFSGLDGVTVPIEVPDGAKLFEWLGARFSGQADGTTLVLEIPDHECRQQGRTE